MKGLVQSVAQVNELNMIQISTNQVKTSAEWGENEWWLLEVASKAKGEGSHSIVGKCERIWQEGSCKCNFRCYLNLSNIPYATFKYTLN